MAQNREAPCYQEYAASMMARVEYRTMSMAARGLLYSMRLECWVNRGVPKNPVALARILGFESKELEAALPEVMPFFAIKKDMIVCPELDDYRTHLEDIRKKQAAGGKRGAAIVNGKRPSVKNADDNNGTGDSTTNPRVPRESLVKSSSEKQNPTQFLESESDVEGDDVHPAYREWMADGRTTAGDYEKASKGY